MVFGWPRGAPQGLGTVSPQELWLKEQPDSVLRPPQQALWQHVEAKRQAAQVTVCSPEQHSQVIPVSLRACLVEVAEGQRESPPSTLGEPTDLLVFAVWLVERSCPLEEVDSEPADSPWGAAAHTVAFLAAAEAFQASFAASSASAPADRPDNLADIAGSLADTPASASAS